MKTNIIVLSFVVMFLVLTAAAKDVKNSIKPSEGEKELKLKFAWIPEDVSGMNLSMCSGYENGKIYYISADSEAFKIIFKTPEGGDAGNVVIPIGKGPGESVQNTGVVIDDNKIFFSDIALGRISMFDMDGEFIDSYDTGAELGIVLHMDICDGILYFHGFQKHELAKFDLKNEQIVKSIPGKGQPKDGDILEGGPIIIDKERKRVIMGHTSIPYSYTEYDLDLNKIRTVYKKDAKKDKKAVWFIRPNMILMNGEIAMSAIKENGTHIFSTNKSGGLSIDSDARGAESLWIKGVINMFDKDSGKFINSFSHEYMRKIHGHMDLLGVDDDNIVVLLTDQSDNINAFVNVESEEPVGVVIAVFENPVK